MRILIYLLICSLSLSLLSCGGDKPNSSKKSKTSKSAPINYDRKVAGETTETTEEEPAEEEVRTVPPEQLAKAKEILAAATEDQIAEVDAKGKYKMFCAACHGYEGDLGVNGAKDLTASTLDMPEAVAQVYFGKGLMTPFKGLLKDHEIVAVSKYVHEELRK